MHAFIKRIVKLLQLFSQERIILSLKNFLYLTLSKWGSTFNELGIILIFFLKVLCIYYQLFESIEHLDSFFVNFCVYNVL